MCNNNILPADVYIVVNKSILKGEDRKILNMLYQPIIGPLPIVLYYLFWSDLEKNEIESGEFTHHHILRNMKFTSNEFINCRKVLEAIGLIKTFYKQDKVNKYIYEIFSPLSAHEFFNHPILNVILYNNVGKQEYERLINYFKTSKINIGDYKDITSSFSDVFDSVPLTSYEIINDSIRKENKLKLNINTNFDFNFLISVMPANINCNRLFTKDNRELIVSLSFIYDIDAMKMGDIIKSLINNKGTITKEDLRKTCRNYYTLNHGGVLPSIIDHCQPEFLRKPVGDNSNRAKMIYTFETISPLDFLKSKSDNGNPGKRDLKLAEDLIIDYGLKPGVVNVLFDYILKTNNNRITRALAETIAGQWNRLKIETVEDAMVLCEKQHKKYKSKPTSTIISYNKKNHEETVPDWFGKNPRKEEYKSGEINEIEEMLKEYK